MTTVSAFDATGSTCAWEPCQPLARRGTHRGGRCEPPCCTSLDHPGVGLRPRARPGRRIAVLTEPLANSSVLVRVAPTLRALGSGAASAAGAVILLGPGSATFDLSFLTCRGGAEARAGTAIDDLAVAAALAARLGGRVLDEPALLVAALPGPVLLRLVPPRRWWRGTWLVRDRDATVRIPARLLLYGGLVLG